MITFQCLWTDTNACASQLNYSLHGSLNNTTSATKCTTGTFTSNCTKAVLSLPQAGILTNKLLQKRLAPHGHYECKHTPGLWKHITCPISFTLVVDNFGVKYERQEDINHLITCGKSKYDLTADWTGNLHCGICLKWDCKQRTLDISMPGYIQKQLQKYKHASPLHPQHFPYDPISKQSSSEA